MNFIGVAPRLPVPGETIRGKAFYTAPGGKGANQAVAAARLGACVRMVGQVGQDDFGRQLIDGLRSEGIDVTGVATSSMHSSGIAVILLDSRRQNHIVAIYGANEECNEAQIMALGDVLEDTDVLLLQLEVPQTVSLAAAHMAKCRGIRVIWDPAPAAVLSQEAYLAMDIMTPNQVELAALTGMPIRDLASARSAASMLLDRGVETVVVKLAETGAYYVSNGQSGFVPSFGVDVVDTVAAGDAFGGGLAVGLVEGGSLEEAVRYASAVGALAVTRSGAQNAMPYRGEVDDLLKNS